MRQMPVRNQIPGRTARLCDLVPATFDRVHLSERLLRYVQRKKHSDIRLLDDRSSGIPWVYLLVCMEKTNCKESCIMEDW